MLQQLVSGECNRKTNVQCGMPVCTVYKHEALQSHILMFALLVGFNSTTIYIDRRLQQVTDMKYIQNPLIQTSKHKCACTQPKCTILSSPGTSGHITPHVSSSAAHSPPALSVCAALSHTPGQQWRRRKGQVLPLILP